MEIQTQLIVDLHKIDKRLNQIEEGKGDLPSQIQELQDKGYDVPNYPDEPKTDAEKAIFEGYTKYFN